MSIDNFNGETFVAFTDISGFKELMKTEIKAVKALDELNKNGYDILRNSNQINGIFVSDSGILFTRQQGMPGLESLLRVIKQLNLRMLNHNIMLTTSIAYGKFLYQDRIEFVGIEKNLLYGNGYVAAFLDNENGLPKIQPGQCRIVIDSLTGNLLTPSKIQETDDLLIRKRKHIYYYWMVQSANQIETFDKKYRDAYNLKYRGMLEALKMQQHGLNPD